MSNGMSALLDLFFTSARVQRLHSMGSSLLISVVFSDCDEDISSTYSLIGPKLHVYI